MVLKSADLTVAARRAYLLPEIDVLPGVSMKVRAFVICSLFLLCVGAGWGQEARGSITGTFSSGFGDGLFRVIRFWVGYHFWRSNDHHAQSTEHLFY